MFNRQAVARTVSLSCIFLAMLVAVSFRVVGLERLPGVNGDETYYPVALMNVRDGHSQDLVSGSGLPLNPLYAVPVYLLHAAHPTPSFALARLPAVLSGLLTVLLAYPLLVRATDRWTALFATLFLACLPATIAYSRFGWDQSQAPLMSLLCLYFAFRRRAVALALCYLATLWVHPMNAFLGAVMLGPIAVRDLHAWRERRGDHRNSKAFGVLPVAVAAVLVVLLAWLGAERAPAPIRNVLIRLVDLDGWWRFALGVGDFVTGATIFRFIVAEPPAWWVAAARVLFWTGLAFLLLVVVPRWWRERDGTYLGLACGVAAAVCGFYLATGLAGVTPGWERYTMWLVTPACVLGGCALSSTGRSFAARSVQLGCALSIGVFLLGSFYAHYFRTLNETGGDAAMAFRTGPVEPKEAAYRAILEKTATEPGQVTVLAEDWFSFYPLKYLAAEQPRLDVIWTGASSPSSVPSVTPALRRFAVGFAGGPLERLLNGHPADKQRLAIPDSADRPVLYVWDLGQDHDTHLALLNALQDVTPR